MIVKFVTKDLLDAMKALKSIFSKGPLVEKGQQKDCLVASKKDGTVVLESAAQGLYVKVTLDAEVEEAGRIVVNHDHLGNIKVCSDNTTFRHKDGDNKMFFKSGSLKGDIIVSQEFDEIESQRPSNIPTPKAAVPWSVLRGGVKRVMFSPTTDAENPSLRIQFQFTDDRLVVTASDSFRMAVFATKLEEPAGNASVIIPAAFIANVISSMPRDSMVKIGTSDKLIRIQGGHIDVCHPVLQSDGNTIEVIDSEARLKSIEKTPPNIEFLIDVAATRQEIASAASIVPPSLGSDVRMDLAISEKGRAIVKVESAIGKANARFTVTNVTIREDLPITFSSKYVLEFLSLLKDGEAVVRIWDKPVLIRSEQYGTTLAMPQLDSVA